MISTAYENRSSVTARDDAHSNLSQCLTGLEWLAFFMTANVDVATACVVDACGVAESANHGSDALTIEWARYGTIRTAIQSQQVRIAQLSSTYERRSCMHRPHAELSAESIELVIAEDGPLLMKLDALCRCALVICGIEKRSVREAASLLGVTDSIVRAAYCNALEYLDVVGCERFRDQNDYAAVCN
ncbi:MAG: hypothetical protein JO187_07360 [Acidobacteria bacterium]|nr:hypothetical protein [Acidobacteriota bacterium]